MDTSVIHIHRRHRRHRSSTATTTAFNTQNMLPLLSLLLLILMPSLCKSQLIPRLHHTTTLLNSTAVLTFGGTVDAAGSTFTNTLVNSNLASWFSHTSNTTQSASLHSAVPWGKDGVLVLFGFANSPNQLSVDAVRLLNVTTGSLLSASTKNPPSGRYGQTATIVGGKIWVQGGQTLDAKASSSSLSSSTVIRNVAVLDPSSMMWNTITFPTNAVGLAQHSTVAVNNFLVSCFGINGTAVVQNSCSLFDTIKSTYVTPLYTSTTFPPPRVYSSMVMAPDGLSLIAFGGCNGDQFYNDVWSLNISQLPKLEWTQQHFPVSNLVPEARCGHTAVLVDANIANPTMMILGGLSATTSLVDNRSYYFDLRKMTWISSIVVQTNLSHRPGLAKRAVRPAAAAAAKSASSASSATSPTSEASTSEASTPTSAPTPASAASAASAASSQTTEASAPTASAPAPTPSPAPADSGIHNEVVQGIIIGSVLLIAIGLMVFIFKKYRSAQRPKFSKNDMPHRDGEDYHQLVDDGSWPVRAPPPIARSSRASKLFGKALQDFQTKVVGPSTSSDTLSCPNYKRKDSLPVTTPPRKGSLPRPRLRQSSQPVALPLVFEANLPARPENIHDACKEADLTPEPLIDSSKRVRSVTSIQWYGFRNAVKKSAEEEDCLRCNGLFITNRSIGSARNSLVASARSSFKTWGLKAYAAIGGNKVEQDQERSIPMTALIDKSEKSDGAGGITVPRSGMSFEEPRILTSRNSPGALEEEHNASRSSFDQFESHEDDYGYIEVRSIPKGEFDSAGDASEDDEDMDSCPQHAAATKILTKLPVISSFHRHGLGTEVKNDGHEQASSSS